MPHIIETTVYEFHELADDWDWWDSVYDDFEEVCRILGIELRTRSVPLMGGGTRQDPCIWFRGFSSQGDGACFEGTYTYAKRAAGHIREHAPKDTDLHRIADRLFAIQLDNFFQLRADIRHCGRYYHAYSMEVSVERDSPTYQSLTDGAEDAVTEALRDLANWLYRQLEREWDHMMSDEYADDAIVANEYTFTAGGKWFGCQSRND